VHGIEAHSQRFEDFCGSPDLVEIGKAAFHYFVGAKLGRKLAEFSPGFLVEAAVIMAGDGGKYGPVAKRAEVGNLACKDVPGTAPGPGKSNYDCLPQQFFQLAACDVNPA
jgi:hypothetical protein